MLSQKNKGERKPFWSSKADELTKLIWLPTRRTLRKKNNFNVSNSWFHSTEVNNHDKNNINEEFMKKFNPEIVEGNMTSRSIKMNLTKLQSRMIRSWIEGSNTIYNYTVSYLNYCYVESKLSGTKLKTMSDYDARDEFIKHFPELNNVPFDIKANAVFDAYKALKSSMSLCKLTKRPFELKPRDEANSMCLPRASFRPDGFYLNYFKRLVARHTEEANTKYATLISELKIERKLLNKAPKSIITELKEFILAKKEANLAKKLDFSKNLIIQFAEPIVEMNHDFRIIHKNGYYIEVPNKLVIKEFPNKKSIVALDPGVRTFNAFYSPQQCGELGKGANDTLFKIQKRKYALQSKLKNEKNSRKRKGIKRALARKEKRIKNLVNELHWKSANYLTKNFEKIIIPVFKVKEMTQGTLNRSTKRQMCDLSHYKFRMRLLYKAKQNGSSVMVCTEEYTSKTCTACGVIHAKLEGNKIFKCPSCKIVVDRDINGARNIMIKALTGSIICTSNARPAV